MSLPGWKLWGTFCPGAPQGRPLHPVLLHPAPEPGPGLQREGCSSVSQRGDQRHLQPGSLHPERTHAHAAVAAGRVSMTPKNEPAEETVFTSFIFYVCTVVCQCGRCKVDNVHHYLNAFFNAS